MFIRITLAEPNRPEVYIRPTEIRAIMPDAQNLLQTRLMMSYMMPTANGPQPTYFICIERPEDVVANCNRVFDLMKAEGTKITVG